MKKTLKEIDGLFVTTLDKCEQFANLARGMEFQLDSCEKLAVLEKRIIEEKERAINLEDEDAANRLLYYQLVTQTLIWELKMWIAFKEDKPEEAWDYLMNAQITLGGAVRAYEVGDILEPYIEKLSLLEELLFPKMMFASVGGEVKKRTCSICKENYDNCDHIKGKPYMGRLCSVVIEEFKLEEISIVFEPANKHCRMTTITDNGIQRNLMTWEKIEKNENTIDK